MYLSLQRLIRPDVVYNLFPKAFDLDLLREVGFRVVQQMHETLDGCNGNLLTVDDRLIPLPLLATSPKCLYFDDLRDIGIDMPKPCPQPTFRQETPQELLEESDSGLRFPVVKILSPLVVIPPGETASSLRLEANDVG
jgi:hypothetical protein